MLARIQLLIVTFWVGSLWTVGYVVAPLLFATLDDRVLAGTLAGRLFRVEAWITIVCGLVLLVLVRYVNRENESAPRTHVVAIIIGMLICTLIGYFGLQPWMASLREASGPAGVMEGSDRRTFGILHGLSSAMYMIQSLLGASLILKMTNMASRVAGKGS